MHIDSIGCQDRMSFVALLILMSQMISLIIEIVTKFSSNRSTKTLEAEAWQLRLTKRQQVQVYGQRGY